MEVKDAKNLVISRCTGEKIVIGDPNDPIGIIEILRASGSGRVKLSCMFASHIQVNREEIAASVAKYTEEIYKK